MTKLEPSAALPEWMPAAAKGTLRPQYVLRSAPSLASDNLIFEIKGTEFTAGSKAAGTTVSIRFPRLVRERDDKGVDDATTDAELQEYPTSLASISTRWLDWLSASSGCRADCALR